MKKSNVALMIICTLIIALFVYAATTKLLDYYNFHFGLTESPFIAPFAGILAWAVPAGELLIAAMLPVPVLRLTGLYASLVLMSLFTVYIAAMLFIGSDNPTLKQHYKHYATGALLNLRNGSLLFDVLFSQIK
jgi:hypothetical protein